MLEKIWDVFGERSQGDTSQEHTERKAHSAMLREVNEWLSENLDNQYNPRLSHREIEEWGKGFEPSLSKARSINLFKQLVDEGYINADLEPSDRVGGPAFKRAYPRYVTDKGLSQIEGPSQIKEPQVPDEPPEPPEPPSPAKAAKEDVQDRLLSRSGAWEGTSQVLTLLFAYIGALAVLAYPVSFVVFWLQLMINYGYGPWRALFAASLVPTPTVVGKVVLVLAYSYLSVLLPVAVWMFIFGRRLRSADERGTVSHPWTFVFYTYAVSIGLAFVVLFIFWAFGWLPDFGRLLGIPVLSSALLVLFLTITFVSLLWGAKLFHSGVSDKDFRWSSLVGGVGIIYLGSIAAAMCLAAGLGDPALPTISIGSNQSAERAEQDEEPKEPRLALVAEQTEQAEDQEKDPQQQAALLGRDGQTWYVACKEKLLAVPADEVGTELILEPISGQDSQSNTESECPPELIKATMDNNSRPDEPSKADSDSKVQINVEIDNYPVVERTLPSTGGD